MSYSKLTKLVQEKAKQTVIDNLPKNGWKFISIDPLIEVEDDENASFEVVVEYSFGNVTHNHNFQVGCEDWDSEVTMEYGEDLVRMDITPNEIIASAYYELALIGLEDKYIQ